MSARRELRLAVLLCLGGSLLTLLAVRHSWASFAGADDLTINAVRTSASGSRVAGAAEACALVGLAGAAAVAATRRVGRVVVGVVIAAGGVVGVADIARLLGDLPHRLAASLSGPGLQIVSEEQFRAAQHPDVRWLWPVLALVGAALTAAGGVLVAVRGRRWAALSSSYEVPAARDPETEPSPKATWDSFDAGHDPTA